MTGAGGAAYQSREWWLEPEGSKHGCVLSTVRVIRENQDDRKFNDLLNASLYSPQPLSGFGYTTHAIRQRREKRLSLNIVRSVIETATSKIAAKSKPKVTLLTDGGDYKTRKRAQKLEKFVEGVFYESGFYSICTDIFRDACVWGTGFAKVYESNKRVAIERVPPVEVVVDDGESLYGAPRTMYHRKYYDRRVLMALYGDTEELKTAIALAPIDNDDREYAYDGGADQVLVTEAWHLPSGPDANDGRHVIAIEGATLVDEAYDRPTFPFAVFKWSTPLVGFFGVGVSEVLAPVQAEINKLLRQIQKGHHYITGHYVVSGNTTLQHINNDLTTILKVQGGTAPQYQVPAIISQEIYAHLERLKAWAYELVGVSQMSANGTKPAGVDAAVALRELNDQQSERFLEVGQRFEEFVLDVGRRVVDCARSIKNYKVKVESQKAAETIDFAEVNLPEDAYVMKMFPTNLLPSNPAGRTQRVQELVNAGLIDGDTGMELLDFPDVEAYQRRKFAARRLILRNIDHILETGERITPTPFDNLELIVQFGNEAIQEAKLDGVEESHIDALRDYVYGADALRPKPQAVPLPPPPMPDPGAMPPPPDMMPPPPMAAA